VDFQLTPEQTEFREATRKLCAGRFGIERLRRTEGVGLDRGMWGELAAFGVFDLRGPDWGLGAAEAALVFEELGRGLVPGPLVWSHLAAGHGLGAVVGGIDRPDRSAASPAVVEHLADLDDLAVLDTDGIWRVDPKSLEGRPTDKPLDPLTPVAIVDELPRGEQIGGPDEAARWRLEGAAFVAAQLAGMAEALTDLTVAYTRERRQFGRPVGSFQAIKHLLADMLVRSELARTQAYAAAVHLDEPSLGGIERSVSAAKAVAGRAAIDNATASIQAHGGMGYTWEVDSHLYLKRGWVLDATFGSSDEHAERVASFIE
jgi:alkylation response protein AidB-like acyl-CoA dehydrogenase